jgi:methionyl-tRNA formyltransferase
MDLVFLGSGAFGLPTLRALAGAHRIRAVVTQPDRPAGRGGAMTPTPIAEWTAANLSGVPLLKPERVNEAAVVREVRGAGAEAWVVIAFGQKMGRALLEGIFATNLHASLLPRWRGASPINAAILAGDEKTGNSVITLAERMDAGAVLGRTERAIDPMQTAGELHDALAADGPDVVMGVLADYAAGRVRREEQDESRVTLAPKLSKADGWVDFADSAEAARRRVHGLTPWPGVTVQFRGQPLKLLRVRPERAERESAPGALIEPETGAVGCGAGTTLALLEVQPAGKRSMAWREYARGQRPAAGEMFTGRSGGVA